MGSVENDKKPHHRTGSLIFVRWPMPQGPWQRRRCDFRSQTIDLYMANQREMNSSCAREETIEILQWDNPQESLQFLRRHQDYKHIKRMVLELEGRNKEAAALR
jgi:hypothetical protein